MESVAAFAWNGWQASSGISGNLGLEYAYSCNVNAFALITSDSDFTHLVMRILEAGLPVFGFGERKTPMPFVNACSQFIYTENLREDTEEQSDDDSGDAAKPTATA
ncbi:NYN domain-containing protein [Marinobacter sp. LQ44]|uniref:NYN domain-containing protein n=1 Tax=unclassified Marinobacter TaxID=83889 RepID=UPI00078D90A1|nr:hypothetical protein ASQ50_06225 [Marinobacter sp. LQ44]